MSVRNQLHIQPKFYTVKWQLFRFRRRVNDVCYYCDAKFLTL